MLSSAELFQLSIEKVKIACNQFLKTKCSDVFLNELSSPKAPVLGIAKIDVDKEYIIKQEQYKTYLMTDKACMVVANIDMDVDAVSREYANIVVVCYPKEGKTSFAGVFIDIRKEPVFKDEEDMSDEIYCKKILQSMFDVIFEARGNAFIYDKSMYRQLFHEETQFNNIDECFWHICEKSILKQDLEMLDIFRPIDIEKRVNQNEIVISTCFRVARDCKEILWIRMIVIFYYDKEIAITDDGMVLLEECTDEMNKKLQNIEYARRDLLTGVYNRGYVEDLIQQRIKILKKGVLVLMDVDRFRNINDIYGHITGDDVLVMISTRISGVLMEEEVLGRFNGDRFVLFIPQSGDKAADKQRVMDIFEASRFQYSENGIDTDIHCSAGAVFFEGEDVEFETLYDEAEVALNRVKISGRDAICVI